MELIAGPPIRKLILVGDIDAEQKSELGGLFERGEIPIGVEFVGGLVVVFLVELFPGFLIKVCGLAGELRGDR